MGITPLCRVAIFSATTSAQVTSTPNSAKQAPVTSPTYPVPITAMCIACSLPLRLRSMMKLNSTRAGPRTATDGAVGVDALDRRGVLEAQQPLGGTRQLALED